MWRWISLFLLRECHYKHSILSKASNSILTLALYILLHVGAKLSPFDNKEIFTSLRFRLDKLATFLITNLPFNLFSKSTAWLPFVFLSPSMFSEFLTFEVPFPISKHAFLHEFFEQSCFDSEFSELLSLLLSLVFKWSYRFSKSGAVFFLERYAPTKTFALLFFLLLFCFLYFVFDIYVMWFLRSIKICLSERFSLLSRHGLLLLHSVLTFWYFQAITNLVSYCFHYHCDYFHCYSYYYFCHCHCCYYFFIFTILVFSILYHIFL